MTSAMQVSTIAGALSSASTSIPAGVPTSLPTALPSGYSNTITVCLDRSNYLLWRTQVIPHITGQGLYGFLDGSRKAPPTQITTGTGANAKTEPNPEFALWWYTDQRVLSILVGAMTEDMVGQMVGRHTAAAVWECTTQMFSAQNRAGIRQIRRQLSTMKKLDMSAAEYYQKMKGFADAMAMVGAPISDDELIDHILVGLGPQYEGLQSSMNVLQAAGSVLSLSEFYSLLLSAEAMKEATSHATDFSSSANAATRQGNFGRGGGQPPFDATSGRFNGRPAGGHQPGHTGGGPSYGSGQNPYGGSQGNRPRNDGGGGNGLGGNGRRQRPRCQICKAWGHEALACRNRFNHGFQPEERRSGNAAASQPQEDKPWFFDTGATDHLTNDMAHLGVHERYQGKDQIQVANGAGQSHKENHTSR